jgi:hypothetical protein
MRMTVLWWLATCAVFWAISVPAMRLIERTWAEAGVRLTPFERYYPLGVTLLSVTLVYAIV